MSSDDDTVSLTSTVLSKHADDEEFSLEGVLAEIEEDGRTFYFVKWEGYPEYENSWVLRENFQSEQTLHDWQDRKMRISRGLEEPFDLEAFYDRRQEYFDKQDKRKQRRREKRIRLGLPVDPLNVKSSTDEDDDAQDSAPYKPNTSKSRQKTKKKPSLPAQGKICSGQSKALNADISDEEMEPVQRQWTSKEKSALMNGLERAKGPHYKDILQMHATILKGITPHQLQAQARLLKQGFIESGKTVPPFLQIIPDKGQVSKASGGKGIHRALTQSRERRSSQGHDQARNTLADAIMGDIQGGKKAAAHEDNETTKENTARLPETASETAAHQVNTSSDFEANKERRQSATIGRN